MNHRDGQVFGVTHSLETFFFKALHLTPQNFSNISWQNWRSGDFSSVSSLLVLCLPPLKFEAVLLISVCDQVAARAPPCAVHAASLLNTGF